MSPSKVVVVVVGGLLDPCGNIGTEGRFFMLPVPWDSVEFAECVSRQISFELNEKARIEFQRVGFPEDPEDERALARGVGLRVWVVCQADAEPLLQLMREERAARDWPPECWSKVEHLIDHLSEHTPSLNIRWRSLDAGDKACIEAVERLIHFLL